MLASKTSGRCARGQCTEASSASQTRKSARKTIAYLHYDSAVVQAGIIWSIPISQNVIECTVPNLKGVGAIQPAARRVSAQSRSVVFAGRGENPRTRRAFSAFKGNRWPSRGASVLNRGVNGRRALTKK